MSPGRHEDMAMPFGKHKGELVADIPDSYLRWLLDQEWVENDYPDLHEQLEIEYGYRKTWRIHK